MGKAIINQHIHQPGLETGNTLKLDGIMYINVSYIYNYIHILSHLYLLRTFVSQPPFLSGLQGFCRSSSGADAPNSLISTVRRAVKRKDSMTSDGSLVSDGGDRNPLLENLWNTNMKHQRNHAGYVVNGGPTWKAISMRLFRGFYIGMGWGLYTCCHPKMLPRPIDKCEWFEVWTNKD